MGILRVDKLSGLETPTAVTGSVAFDGNDNLSIGSAGDFNFLHNGATDWTAEFWSKVASNSRQFVFGTGASSAQIGFSFEVMTASDGQSATQGVFAMYGRGSAGNYRYFGADKVLSLNTWHHIAAVFKASDKTLTIYVDGKEVDSDTGTANGSFGTGDYSGSNSSYAFIVGKNIHGSTYLTGDISNLRIVAGRRLYTSNFTPPVHALEPISGTRILCCNNPDSVTAVSNTDIGNGYTATASGDPTVSTDNPSLTRDFTDGTEFGGVTTFDTQGYFVPPSGTTEQRNLCGTRGLFGGSNPTPADGSGNAIEFITVSTTGNSQDFGDRIGKGRRQIAAMADRTRAVFAGSYSPMGDTIDFVTISSTGNATDFGNCLTNLTEATGISNSTRGIMAGGRTPTVHDVMQYVTIKSLGNAIDFGNLIVAKRNCGSFQSPTRGVVVGGRNSGGTSLKVIEYVEISTLGNSVDFGDLSTAGGEVNMGGSNSVRGIIGGGNPSTNAIEYVTISTTGNSQDFGDNTAAARGLNTMATSPTRACMYGAVAPARDLSYVEIATTGDAQDFGNLSIDPTSNYHAGTSNGHGGLS